MKLATIEERVLAQADQQLRNEIHTAAKQLGDLLCNGVNYQITFKSPNDDRVTAVRWVDVLHALKEKAFELQAPRRRETALGEFCEKIERCQKELEEIRNYGCGASEPD